jgi:hypothetical protein
MSYSHSKFRMHSKTASGRKPKIQFSQCQDAQTPKQPVAKQPKFIMPTCPCRELLSVMPAGGPCRAFVSYALQK